MAKKPKHDDLTKWASGGTLSKADIYPDHLLASFALPAMSQVVSGSYSIPAQMQTPTSIGTVWTDTVNISVSTSPSISWGDLAVGQTCDVYTLREYARGKLRTTLDESGMYHHLSAEDGSKGVLDPMTGTVTKTKGPDPVATPDDIEETTELVIGWRTYTVKDYKLRGSWNAWESRVYHASCNCAEFDELSMTELPLHEERRDLMRQHLAAGTGTCGVYSRKSLNLGKDYHYGVALAADYLRVAAKCVNYGLGYEYDGGYRSEFCRIEHLFVLTKGDSVYELSDVGVLVPGSEWERPYAVGTVAPATLAQILSTTYGVPCDVMSPLEFAYKHDEGML